MRLVEMTASAIHQIAVTIFELEDMHQGDIASVTSWEKPRRPIYWEDPQGRTKEVKLAYFPPAASLFVSGRYQYYEQYPSGIADMAAYWAEDRIFGGVVLFDRGENDDDVSRSTWIIGLSPTLLPF